MCHGHEFGGWRASDWTPILRAQLLLPSRGLIESADPVTSLMRLSVFQGDRMTILLSLLFGLSAISERDAKDAVTTRVETGSDLENPNRSGRDFCSVSEPKYAAEEVQKEIIKLI